MAGIISFTCRIIRLGRLLRGRIDQLMLDYFVHGRFTFVDIVNKTEPGQLYYSAGYSSGRILQAALCPRRRSSTQARRLPQSLCTRESGQPSLAPALAAARPPRRRRCTRWVAEWEPSENGGDDNDGQVQNLGRWRDPKDALRRAVRPAIVLPAKVN